MASWLDDIKYRCDKCGTEDMIDPSPFVCKCGGKMKLVGSIPGAVILDYFDEGLNARITGPGQKKELMKKMDVSEV
jgi:hypothetical protein